MIARSLEIFESLVDPEVYQRVQTLAREIEARLGGRTVWSINSTPQGGGVAEMLRTIISYARGAGVDARWLVIGGDAEFFRVTKRLHNALHGAAGDASALDVVAHSIFDRVTADNARELDSFIQPGDVVIVHDPQPAGLIRTLVAIGARVIWRCHIGSDEQGPEVAAAWAFLRPYVEPAHALVFSRAAYAPPALRERRPHIVAPTIDPMSAKNQPLDGPTVRSILACAGLIDGPDREGDCRFTRADGAPGRVARGAEITRVGRAPSVDAPMVVQVSRWDRLKDHAGVMRGFARFIDARPSSPAQLVLAGPSVAAVADDPEGAAVFEEILRDWRALPHGHRRHIHLVNLPMDDVEENAAIVNALQRHAAVVVQKSLREGFGLTVTEAMWKERPVIASRIGGIQDQIEHGASGLLLDDPTNDAAFADALSRVLTDPDLAARLGAGARERVRQRFLGLHSLLDYGALLGELLA